MSTTTTTDFFLYVYSTHKGDTLGLLDTYDGPSVFGKGIQQQKKGSNYKRWKTGLKSELKRKENKRELTNERSVKVTLLISLLFS